MTDRILFVCTGNTCRSPMAAAAFQQILSDAGVNDVEVDAAGLYAMPGTAVNNKARQVLAENQIPLLRLQSQQLTAKLVKRSDLIVTMTDEHRDAVREQFRLARLKTVPLMAFCDAGPSSVPDPIGSSIDVYRETLAMMMPALKSLATQRYGLD